mgnify:CR=1 FL=1
MKDPTWGFPEIPFSYEGVKTTATWAELLAGIKVNVYKNFYMGLVTALPHTHEHEKDGTHRALVYSRFRKEQLD